MEDKERDNISCDRCGYYDSSEKFLYESSLNFKDFMKRFGFDLDNSRDKGHFYTMYAGAICPECGNFSSLDFNPDKGLEKDLKINFI